MERMLSLGFEDVIDLTSAHRFTEVGATAISVTAGRVDWTAFPWPEHEASWSPWVRDTGRDYVAEAIAAAGDRTLAVIVDVMVEGWIARDPSIAGVDARGEHSTEFASVSALAGVVGTAIVELIVEVVDRYDCTVTLTELFLDRWTFGDDDLSLFRQFVGVDDWPRTRTGEIDEAHPSIGQWRSDAVAALVARCAAVTRAVGHELHVEVRAHWDGPTARDGQDYERLLAACDRLVIWGYSALAHRPTSDLEGLAREAPLGSTISVGLWQLSAPELRRSVDAASQGGATSVAVVPMSLMTESHWAALALAWR
ncbi:MAG: hypothetical protein ACOH19_01925 [Rhodoglobus sp.]